jgi:hypothetical protein
VVSPPAFACQATVKLVATASTSSMMRLFDGSLLKQVGLLGLLGRRLRPTPRAGQDRPRRLGLEVVLALLRLDWGTVGRAGRLCGLHDAGEMRRVCLRFMSLPSKQDR